MFRVMKVQLSKLGGFIFSWKQRSNEMVDFSLNFEARNTRRKPDLITSQGGQSKCIVEWSNSLQKCLIYIVKLHQFLWWSLNWRKLDCPILASEGRPFLCPGVGFTLTAYLTEAPATVLIDILLWEVSCVSQAGWIHRTFSHLFCSFFSGNPLCF